LRSFIAIELPETVKSALLEFQQGLKKCGADVRWVRPDSIHLTLKFLGDIKENDVDGIVKIIEGACRKYSAFDVEVGEAGAFPNKKSPRVLWVGVHGNEALIKLQGEIEDGMAFLGFEKEERKFSPHLTLGRFRSLREKDALMEEIESYKDNSFGLMEVKSISLMKSELSPAGAKYTRVAEVALGG